MQLDPRVTSLRHLAHRADQRLQKDEARCADHAAEKAWQKAVLENDKVVQTGLQEGQVQVVSRQQLEATQNHFEEGLQVKTILIEMVKYRIMGNQFDDWDSFTISCI